MNVTFPLVVRRALVDDLAWVRCAHFIVLKFVPTRFTKELRAQIARGLITTGDSSKMGYALVDRLLGLFPDPYLGTTAARAIRIVMNNDDGLLTKTHHARIKVRTSGLSRGRV